MQTPDLGAIQRERSKSLQRYDIAQSMAANARVVVVGTQSGAALVSKDHGQTWERTELGPVSLVDIAACGASGFIGIDHYHKVWSADAGGGNWKPVPLTAPRTPLAVACDKAEGWWVSGIHAVIAGSTDRGATWKVTDLGEDAQITSLQFTDDKHGIALGEFGLSALTDDGGATWRKGPRIPGDFYPYAALFISRDEGWVSGLAGQILHTTDGGKTWRKQPNAAQATLNRLFLHDGAPFGVGAGGVIARLDGDRWRAVPYTDPVPVFLGSAASLSGQSAIVIGGPGGLLRTVSTHAEQ